MTRRLPGRGSRWVSRSQYTSALAVIAGLRDHITELLHRDRSRLAAIDRLAAEVAEAEADRDRWQARWAVADAAVGMFAGRCDEYAARCASALLLPAYGAAGSPALVLADGDSGSVMDVDEWQGLLLGDPDLTHALGAGAPDDDGDDAGAEVCGWLDNWPTLPARRELAGATT